MKKLYFFLLKIFFILLGIVVYARYVGTSGLVTKEYTVNSNIPESFDGIKVVHFSDLHYNRAISLNKVNKVIEEINLINPDIVLFTGDLIDQDAELIDNDFLDLTKALSKIEARYGKYAVLGCHDYGEKENIINVFNDSNFNYLENSYDIIYNNHGDKIFIGGIGNVTHNESDIDKTMEYFNENEDNMYKIILVHEPDISDKIVKKYDINLILAGHSHGGQIRLPFIGALYTPENSKKYYDEYYEIGSTKLYISSGIGVRTVNYRLWNRPSVNFYRINNGVSK